MGFVVVTIEGLWMVPTADATIFVAFAFYFWAPLCPSLLFWGILSVAGLDSWSRANLFLFLLRLFLLAFFDLVLNRTSLSGDG